MIGTSAGGLCIKSCVLRGLRRGLVQISGVGSGVSDIAGKDSDWSSLIGDGCTIGSSSSGCSRDSPSVGGGKILKYDDIKDHLPPRVLFLTCSPP
jgi:hypothetical protein